MITQRLRVGNEPVEPGGVGVEKSSAPGLGHADLAGIEGQVNLEGKPDRDGMPAGVAHESPQQEWSIGGGQFVVVDLATHDLLGQWLTRNLLQVSPQGCQLSVDVAFQYLWTVGPALREEGRHPRAPFETGRVEQKSSHPVRMNPVCRSGQVDPDHSGQAFATNRMTLHAARVGQRASRFGQARGLSKAGNGCSRPVPVGSGKPSGQRCGRTGGALRHAGTHVRTHVAGSLEDLFQPFAGQLGTHAIQWRWNSPLVAQVHVSGCFKVPASFWTDSTLFGTHVTGETVGLQHVPLHLVGLGMFLGRGRGEA